MRHRHGIIALTVLLNQVIGFFFYSPLLFLDPWLAGQGKRIEDLDQANPLPFILAIVGAFAACYTLSSLLMRTASFGAASGARMGLVLGLGICLPMLSTHYAFLNIAGTVSVLDNLNTIISLVVCGALLGRFRAT